MGRVRRLNGEGNQSKSSGDCLVRDYVDFLCRHRGLRPESARNHEKTCERLLTFLGEYGFPDLTALQPEAIHHFLIFLGTRYARKTLSSQCADLRGFLKYLYRHGVTPTDLSPVVVAPRVYKHEGCPRFLTRAEIEAVLRHIDRTSAVGRRTYAMVLLLAVYGLRAGEVVRLRLEAIDWRQQQLHIRQRKAGNTTVYPLDPAVAEAILSYLKQDRPASKHREIFLSSHPPFGPFTTSGALYYQARRHIAKAGIQVERPGTHVFRYSCAQRLFEQGMPLKTIADFLGHGDLESTRRYTKIAFEQLREVALGDGEAVL